MNFYKLQINDNNPPNRINYVDEVLADYRITAALDFAGEEFTKLQKGDVVLVHKGSNPYALTLIKQRITNSEDIKGISFGIDYRVEILSYFEDVKDLLHKGIKTRVGHSGTFQPLKDVNTATYNFISAWFYLVYTTPKLINAYDLYIEKCKNSDWVEQELYKYEWSYWLNEHVNFEQQTDDEILALLVESQQQEYTNSKGVQFIKAGAREKLSKFIGIEDVKIFRKYFETRKLEESDFENRNTSFTIASCYLSSLFPNDWAPASSTNFIACIRYLFNEKPASSGLAYIESYKEFFDIIEEDFKEDESIITLFLEKLDKKSLTQIDFNWMVQDFMLFVYRELLPNTYDDFLNELLENFTKKDLEIYFSFLRDILSHNNIEYGDIRCTYTFFKDRVNLTIGQLYSLNIFNKTNKKRFGVISKKPINEESEQYEGNNNEVYYTYIDNLNFSDEQIQNINEGIQFQLKRTNKSGYRKFNNEALERYVFNIKRESNKMKDEKRKSMKTNQPLNQILYGPPGTGKTYKTKQLAVEIITGEIIEDRNRLTEEYNKLKDAGQIVFTTFHQSMSYEDFVEGIKPKTENEQVVYEVEDGIFKELCDKAKTKTNTNFDETYDKLVNQLSENDNEFLILKTPRNREFRVNLNSNLNLSLYTTSEVKLQGTLTKSKLKRHYAEENAFQGWEGYATGVINYLIKNFDLTKDKNNKSENYVIIIDEINRANVSAVFGELITLLEPDKRLGEEEAITLKLPYSKTDFGVPSNLYIIGTMNTADRSVEALDTALRRRFEFEEVMPKPNLLSPKNTILRLWNTPKYLEMEWDNKEYRKAADSLYDFLGIDKSFETKFHNLDSGNEDYWTMEDFNELNENDFIGINLEKLLKTINNRIEILLDRDHTIGHSYFLKVNNEVDLRNVFKNNIIPLLQEYFYGDYEKIGLILGNAFFEEETIKYTDTTFANFKTQNKPEHGEILRLKTINEDFNIIDAVNTLLNITSTL